MSGSLRTEFDLFLECIPDSQRWKEAYSTLRGTDTGEAKAFLDKYGINYIVVGARDVWNYGFDIDKVGRVEGFELVFNSGEAKIYQRK
jgi:uncharacterized membrane protein